MFETTEALEFLNDFERTFVKDLVDPTCDDKTSMDIVVKGFEQLSFEWAVHSSKLFC